MKMAATSIPSPKQEPWKYSNLPAVLKGLDLRPAAAVWELTGAFEFLAPGLPWTPPPGDAAGLPSLWSLNATCPGDPLCIRVPAGKKPALPIHLVLNGKPGQLAGSRLRIEIGEGADVILLEHHKGQETYWKNMASLISVGANARLRHYRIVEDDLFAVTTQVTQVALRRDAAYENFTLTTGARFSRHEVEVRMLASNGSASLSGVTLLSGRQVGDSTILVQHEAPQGRSNQLFKTLLDGQARGVFQGKIRVHREAQKTDGYQLSSNLLLSPLAEMDVKPELEIYADDVKCSHGSATGALDEGPLFYLRSRGLPEQAARRLLTEAFLGEATATITDDAIRADMESRVKTWLG